MITVMAGSGDAAQRADASAQRTHDGSVEQSWDFFVSHADNDEAWAEWIAYQLHDMGFRVLTRLWDGVPGTRRFSLFEKGLSSAHTMALFSKAYLESASRQVEWETVCALDNQDGGRRLVPIRLEEIPLPRTVSGIESVDVFDRSEADVRAALTAASVSSTEGMREACPLSSLRARVFVRSESPAASPLRPGDAPSCGA